MCVGVFVGVKVGVAVAVLVGVAVGVGVKVCVGVLVGVKVGVAVGVLVSVAVAVGVKVRVGVLVGVKVGVAVDVKVLVGVWVRVALAVGVVVVCMRRRGRGRRVGRGGDAEGGGGRARAAGRAGLRDRGCRRDSGRILRQRRLGGRGSGRRRRDGAVGHPDAVDLGGIPAPLEIDVEGAIAHHDIDGAHKGSVGADEGCQVQGPDHRPFDDDIEDALTRLGVVDLGKAELHLVLAVRHIEAVAVFIAAAGRVEETLALHQRRIGCAGYGAGGRIRPAIGAGVSPQSHRIGPVAVPVMALAVQVGRPAGIDLHVVGHGGGRDGGCGRGHRRPAGRGGGNQTGGRAGGCGRGRRAPGVAVRVDVAVRDGVGEMVGVPLGRV